MGRDCAMGWQCGRLVSEARPDLANWLRRQCLLCSSGYLGPQPDLQFSPSSLQPSSATDDDDNDDHGDDSNGPIRAAGPPFGSLGGSGAANRLRRSRTYKRRVNWALSEVTRCINLQQRQQQRRLRRPRRRQQAGINKQASWQVIAGLGPLRGGSEQLVGLRAGRVDRRWGLGALER